MQSRLPHRTSLVPHEVCLRAVRAADHSGDQIGNLMPSDRPQLTLELTRCMPF